MTQLEGASTAGAQEGPGELRRARLYERAAEHIAAWIAENRLVPGDRLPPERELAASLGISRATLSQALVALEVIGVLEVRHGSGAVVTSGSAPGRVLEAIRAHVTRLPEIIEARDALESKLAALAAQRRQQEDLRRIDAALQAMEEDIASGGRGLEGDELFHAAVVAAARSSLLAAMMAELSGRIRETRIESLSQQGRPAASLKGHRRIAAAIREGDAAAAAQAMHDHIEAVSRVEHLDG